MWITNDIEHRSERTQQRLHVGCVPKPTLEPPSPRQTACTRPNSDPTLGPRNYKYTPRLPLLFPARILAIEEAYGDAHSAG